MADYIKLKNLPTFGKCDLIDTNEEILTFIVGRSEMGSAIRTPETFYIKGINKESIVDRKIDDSEIFFKDYLKLGENLYKIATTEHDITFLKPKLLENENLLNSKYIEKTGPNYELRKKYGIVIDNIYELQQNIIDCIYSIFSNDIIDNCIKNNLFTKIGKWDTDIIFSNPILDDIDDIITVLTIIDARLKINVKNEINILYNVLNECYENLINPTELIKKIENFCCNKERISLKVDYILKENKSNLRKNLLDSIFDYDNSNHRTIYIDFNKFFDFNFINISKKSINSIDKVKMNIKKIVDDNMFTVRKLITTSNAKSRTNYKTTQVEFNNYFEVPPIEIRFSYNQLDDVKKMILPWLEKYGFPYYVNENDEMQYRQEMKNELSDYTILENEYYIPCEYLIVNSIYNYTIYSLLYLQHEANQMVKDTFLIEDNLSRRKLKEINEMRNSYSYYMNNICDTIFSIKINSKDINKYIGISKNDAKISNNRFVKKIDEEYYIIPISNLCIAANMIVDDNIYYTLLDKRKYCPICDEWKKPDDFKYKLYCSDDCRNIGRRIKDTISKSERRKRQKEREKRDS